MGKKESFKDEIIAAAGAEHFAKLFRFSKSQGHTDEEATADAESFIMAQYHVWMALGRPKRGEVTQEANDACMERALEIAATNAPGSMTKEQFYEEIRKAYRSVDKTTDTLGLN